MSAATGSPGRAIFYALLANLAIAVSKLLAGLYTGSGSIIAEAVHSLADTANQVLLYIGLRGAAKPADADHPLGYGKLTYFWSFIVALMLFSMGGLFSVYEGMHKLAGGDHLHQPWVGLLVLLMALLLESLSLAGCLREVKLIRGTRPLASWLEHTRNAEIIMVIGEDVAAIIGLILALGFLSTAWLTGNPTYDAWGSVSVGCVLILVAVFAAIRVQSLLVGKSAEPDLRRLLDEAIAEDEHILEVLNTITLHFGARIMLAAKIRMDDDLSIGDAVNFINQLEVRIKAQFPEVGWCFIEPDDKP